MKFITSGIVEETSLVTVRHKRKLYVGKSRLHPEDEFSKFTGCRYAEMRAEIAALKDEYKEKKAACEECRKFVNAVSQYKDFDKESKTAKAMFRQLNRRIREVNRLADEISRRMLALDMAIKQQDEFKHKIKQNTLIEN